MSEAIKFLSKTSFELAEIIGLEEVLMLSKKIGGLDMYLTGQDENQSFLLISSLIGKEKAEKLQKYFRKAPLYIPKNKRFWLFFKRRRFVKEVKELIKDKKMSYFAAMRFTAHKFKITESIAKKWCPKQLAIS